MPESATAGRVAMRRRVILDALREHPGSTAGMLTTRILDETGGPPAIRTGALFVPSWTVYSDLKAMEQRGMVSRIQATAREVLWVVAQERP